jgi:hypothetical protein
MAGLYLQVYILVHFCCLRIMQKDGREALGLYFPGLHGREQATLRILKMPETTALFVATG